MRKHPVATIATILAFVLMLAPIPLLVWMSFFDSRFLVFPPQNGYTLDWYTGLHRQTVLFRALGTSLILALIAALISTFVGMLGAFAVSRSRIPGRRAAANLFLLPLIVPSITSGLALYLYLYNLEGILNLELVPQLATLVAAHVVITLPWTFRFMATGIGSISPHVERASLSLGRGPMYTFFLVTLPLLRPSVIGAALLAFVFSFGDLEISLFLIGPGETTLPVAMVQYASFQVDPTIAAIAVVQIAIIAVILFVGDRFFKFGNVFSGGSKQ